MSGCVTARNSVSLCCFQSLIREVEEKEVSGEQCERDASLRTVLSVAFTLIYPLRLKNITRYVHQPDGHSRHCFSTSAAAQKAGLDGAGAPRDVPEFGKGAL